MSVVLGTRATFVKKNPGLAARIGSFNPAGSSTYFPYFRVILVQIY